LSDWALLAQERRRKVEIRGKRGVITDGVILIALGVLIFLNTANIYIFSESWPLLLIVISIYVLVRNIYNTGGWAIGVIGAIFLVIRNFYPDLDKVASYILPLLLIFLGAYMLFTCFKRRQSN
jgi:putative Mn2+ efflux pump MntP